MDANLSLNESSNENCSYFMSQDVTDSPLVKASKMVNTILPPILLLIGIPGNILTMIVIIRQRKTLTSTAIYLLLLAISDTLFLIIGTFVDWLLTLGVVVREADIIICKLLNLMYYWSAQFSSWILVAITVDRIISIVFPHRYTRLCTPLVSKVSGLIIGLILLAINTHFLYGFGFSDTYLMIYGSSCGPLELEAYQSFYFDIWPWLDLSLLFIVPFVVLCIGNSVILFRLVQINSKKTKTGGKGGDKKGQRSIRSITVLVLLLNVVFLICISPLSVFLVNEVTLHSWADEVMCVDDAEFEYRNGIREIIISSVICLSYINPSINFVLYVLSGTKFRNEIKALLTCKAVGKENAL